MAIKASDAIRAARALIGTPYVDLDCIGLIVRVIRTAPGGVPSYRTAGTNTLWKSATASAKYRDLTWRQEGISGARAGMLAFKLSGTDIHHVGLVTGEGTVIHSSSAKGCVVETTLDGSWGLLAVHRYIDAATVGEKEDESMATLYKAMVTTDEDPLRVRDAPRTGRIIGHVPKGDAVDVLTEGDWPRIWYGDLVGYASADYLTRVVDVDFSADNGSGTDDPGDKGLAGMPGISTTLISDNGTSIVLVGKWRVAED